MQKKVEREFLKKVESVMNKKTKPYILAPAGDRDSFLAAVAAGADAVYCGLKMFSARMEAENFSVEELAGLVSLAGSKGVEVYVAFNTSIKQSELEKTARILKKLVKYVKPHALIVQDMAVVTLARKAGFKGQMHLSTLANSSFAAGLDSVKKAGFARAVLPRELTVDEIKQMAEKRPQGLDLEVFIHGALCYAVSGRCYWSSWFGGKSGLRGRCVQPCRRMYSQNQDKQRFFSCLDFSVDVLVKVLKNIPGVTTWKIEGRKKSPHYVFYTVKAYKMLRDHGDDPQKKKIALSFLEYALGRPSTHYNFLSQRMQNPLKKDAETGSGLFTGRVKIADKPYFTTREPLIKGDLLRIGYEDAKGHAIQRVTRSVPKKGRFVLKQGRQGRLQKGAPVFIVDRREKEIALLIKELAAELEKIEPVEVKPVKPGFDPVPREKIRKKDYKKRSEILEITLCRKALNKRSYGKTAMWFGEKNVPGLPSKVVKNTWWWLPPVVWPGEEEQLHANIKKALLKGASMFVLNMPWQISFFDGVNGIKKGLELWAGPFCNVSNSATVKVLKDAGFSGVIVSPELDSETFLSLPGESSLPLGAVVQGNWPLAISRIVSSDILLDHSFSSPMGERGWVTRRDGNYWVFPGWRLDLKVKQEEMEKAGYSSFITMEENVPKGMVMKKREGLWNWNLRLL